MKDNYTRKSIFTQIREAIVNESYNELSDLQILLEDEMKNLRKLYTSYRRNLMNI